MINENFNAGIIATGSYLPEKIITNKDIANMGVDTSDEWIKQKIGISSRHSSADDEEVHHLAAKAVNDLLNNTNIKSEDIDLIICSSTTPNYFCPATACLVQKEINAKNAAAFDINSVCSNPIITIEIACKFIKDGTYKNIIIVSSEAPTKGTDWKKRDTSVFFGDGAAAVLIGRVDKDKGLLSTYFKSDGTRHHVLVSKTDDRKLIMDGKAIFEFATNVFPESIKEVTEKAGYKIKDVDFIISHQANLNIIKTSMQKLNLPMSKTHTVIETTGNTIGASALIALDSAVKQGKIKTNDLIALVAFGGGLSWGANLIRWT